MKTRSILTIVAVIVVAAVFWIGGQAGLEHAARDARPRTLRGGRNPPLAYQ